MPRAIIGEYPSDTMLGNSAETGSRASAADFGAQIGESMQGLGSAISRGSATVADISAMHQHVVAQQWVSTAMDKHRVVIDKYMADPANYSDPKFAENVDALSNDSLETFAKEAPNQLASKQFTMEAKEFHSSRMNSAFKTQTDVMMQKGIADFEQSPDSMLDSYRSNLKSPNIDASADLLQNFDQHLQKIDRTYGTIAPATAKSLRDKATVDLAYGVLNTNPDLAEKVLDRGPVEGRVRHTIENAITSARGAQDEGAKQEALDATKGLLEKAEMFPDQVQKGFPKEYFEAHGFGKRSGDMAVKLQYQLDVNKDYAGVRDQITGSNESALVKRGGDMYQALKNLDPASDQFHHDAQVLQRTQKFINESIQKIHADPVAYIANNNKEIASATQAYRDDPSPQRFGTLTSLLKKYQGAVPIGESSDKYLNLSMHEMHLLDKTQAETVGQAILDAGPKQAGEILHNTIQQYKPDDQGIVLNDLVNHGKIPMSSYAMERVYGAPFANKVTGALMNQKELRDTVGKQKGSTTEDLDKLLTGNNQWQQWSKVTAADNFQRQDVVSGYQDAIHAYSLGLIQKGMSPAAAVDNAVKDLTQWNHDTVVVNGRAMQLTKNQYAGTPREFSMAVGAAIDRLDMNRINFLNDNHTEIFPVLNLAGHKGARDEALKSIMHTKLFPNMNPDGKSFSLYVRGESNDFQLRDKDGKPVTMQVADLPTFTYPQGTHPVYSGDPFGHNGPIPYSTTSTNWPAR